VFLPFEAFMLLRGILPPVANLPPVSTTLVVDENLRKDVTTGVVDTRGAH
jgi:hypothetical protein